VAAEGKHVDPPPQPVIRRALAELPGNPNQPVHVVTDPEQRQCFWADAAVAEAEVFSAFGGVLGDVAGRMLWGQRPGRATVDSLGVELLTEPQHQPTVIGHVNGQPHVRGRLPDRLRKHRRIDVDLWRVEVAGTIEPDQCVEVDDAAALEFRDLDERHPAPPAELRRRQAGPVGEGAAQSDGEPAP
jgi:hypothetical protein